MLEGPISGWPCWMTSHPVLRDIPSDLNYIPTVSHPVDHLESGRKVYTSASTLSLEKMAGKCRSPLSASLCKVFEELLKSHCGGNET